VEAPITTFNPQYLSFPAKATVSGYPTSERNVNRLATDLVLGGRARIGPLQSSELINISAGIIQPGMSGSPILLENGDAVGIVSFSRKYNEAHGGYGIPASTICMYLGIVYAETRRPEPSRGILLDLMDAARWIGYATTEEDGWYQSLYIETIVARLVSRTLDDKDARLTLGTVQAYDAVLKAVQSLRQSTLNVRDQDYQAQPVFSKLRPDAARGLFSEVSHLLQRAIMLLSPITSGEER
jgi:hypothetical protein